MTPSPTTRWLDDFFRSYHALRPVNATFVGVHEHDHRLPDMSESGVGDWRAGTEGLLSRARRLEGERGAGVPGVRPPGSRVVGRQGASRSGEDPPGRETEMEALDRRLATGFLNLSLWEMEGPHGFRGNPTFFTGEATFGLLSLCLSDYAPLEERMEAVLRRMASVPAFLDRGRRWLASGPGCHHAWTDRALRECTGALAFLDEGVEILAAALGAPGAGGAAAAGVSGSASLADALRRGAAEAARAFGDFRHWLETEFRDGHVDEVACGPEILDLHIREGHFLPYRAREIADLAREEMASTRRWLAEHARDHGAATPEEVLARLAQHRPTAESYLGRYREIWEGCRRVAEDHDLVSWPDHAIEYAPRPSWSRAAAPHLYFLFYRSPAAQGAPPVHPYMISPLPERGEGESAAAFEERLDTFLTQHNDSVIRGNHVIHHGGLGHHVQNAFARRAPSRVGRMAATDCASRIAMHCGGTMAEGWACYTTELMAELAEAGVEGGMTRLEAYGERASRIRMCARAIVDVELHTGRMTLEEAVAFYRREAGMTQDSALGEATKNSLFPGGALMYLMGTHTVHHCRRSVGADLGSGSSLRRFHDRFLSWGSIPATLAGELTATAMSRERPDGTP